MTKEEARRKVSLLRHCLEDYEDFPLYIHDEDLTALDMAISALSENKGDLISRQAVINAIANTCFWLSADNWEELIKCINSIQPVENKGEWIYDKGINNWRCSKCGQTPPPTGYVGKADFMATHFKFCNHCGADMRGDKAE